MFVSFTDIICIYVNYVITNEDSYRITEAFIRKH